MDEHPGHTGGREGGGLATLVELYVIKEERIDLAFRSQCHGEVLEKCCYAMLCSIKAL